MQIILLCATERGLRCLKRFRELAPHVKLTVFSFREETWEPPYFDAIKAFTLACGGQFHEGKLLGDKRWIDFWRTVEVDTILAINWRYLIPSSIYLKARVGTFVFHDSMLPKYRGFSPTNWAIVNGECECGVSLFRIADEIDSGPIIDQQPIPIGEDEYISDVMEKVSERYLEILERNIRRLLAGNVVGRMQDHSKATYTCKRLPQDNLINWADPTTTVFNLIRASSTPYPGAYTYLGEKRLIIWAAQRLSEKRNYIGRIPGRIVEILPKIGSIILTGDGQLLLTKVQIEGDSVVNASELLKSPTQTLKGK